MRLPGGLWEDGALRRGVRFRPLTGRTELTLAEADPTRESVVAQVTDALVQALDEVGGGAATPERVERLSVPDRQFLMLHLASRVQGEEERWLTGVCGECEEPFQLRVDPSQMPVKPAGPTYPFAEADTSGGRIRLRVPTGADQARIEAERRDARALRLLAAALVVDGDVDADGLTDEDVERIDAALEETSPEVGTRVATTCPGCGEGNELYVDPYRVLGRRRSDLLHEIHRLAGAYGWSEDEILSLPWERRRAYLGLVQKGRGMTGSPA